jgi:glycosyltransferase involved in cell wall biosynthesis
MRVAIISNGTSDGLTGGLGVAARALASGLEKNGLEVFLIRPTFDQSKPLVHLDGNELLIRTSKIEVTGDPSISSFSVYGPRWKDVVQIAQLRDFIKGLRIDVFHFHHLIGFGPDFFYLLKQACPNARFVYTFHDAGPICLADGQLYNYFEQEQCDGPQVNKCQKCLSQFGNHLNPSSIYINSKFAKDVLMEFDVLTAPSTFLSKKVEEHLGSQCVVIRNVAIKSEKSLQQNNQKFSEKRNKIGYFGQVTFIKGVDILVDSVLNHNKKFTNLVIELQIHGTGTQDYVNELKSRLALNDPKNRVQICGGYKQRNVQSLLSDVDWVAVPSRWAENAPLVVTESLAAGKPLLMTGNGGKAEMVDFGFNALEVFSDDVQSWERALNNIMSGLDQDQYRQMSINCLQKFGDEDISKEYIDLYTK